MIAPHKIPLFKVGRHLHWLAEGPPATHWANEPRLPVVNLEPNYELHPAYGSKVPFTDRKVRRAAYWSLMVHPAAGVTYGCNPIWNWGAETEVPEGRRLTFSAPDENDWLLMVSAPR